MVTFNSQGIIAKYSLIKHSQIPSRFKNEAPDEIQRIKLM